MLDFKLGSPGSGGLSCREKAFKAGLSIFDRSKKLVSQLSPSQQGRALVLQTGHW
jgi:hypothetical protein